MTYLIDDIARSLAKETPRRQTFKLIFGALAATVFGSRLSAQQGKCAPSCVSGQQCCSTGSKAFCAPAANKCCGNVSCSSTQTCCGTGSSAFCAPAGNICCGNAACPAGYNCVNKKCVSSVS